MKKIVKLTVGLSIALSCGLYLEKEEIYSFAATQAATGQSDVHSNLLAMDNHHGFYGKHPSESNHDKKSKASQPIAEAASIRGDQEVTQSKVTKTNQTQKTSQSIKASDTTQSTVNAQIKETTETSVAEGKKDLSETFPTQAASQDKPEEPATADHEPSEEVDESAQKQVQEAEAAKKAEAEQAARQQAQAQAKQAEELRQAQVLKAAQEEQAKAEAQKQAQQNQPNQITIKDTVIPLVDAQGAGAAPQGNLAGIWNGTGEVADNAPTHIIGHNPGAFAVVFELAVGNQLKVTDKNGQQKEYTVYNILKVNDEAIGEDGLEHWEDILNQPGESISLQACIDDHWNLMVLAR